MPPYSKHSHAQALVISGILMGINKERTDREVREDTGLNPEVIRQEIVDGNYDENALKFLAIFDATHKGLLSRLAASNVLSSLLNLG
jgi:hypothetical protein